MKKLIALLLAALMVASVFAGCNGQSGTEGTKPSEVIEDFAQVDWD